MMMNCPKCGFPQPDDQYCANCGVDTKAFIPIPKSFWQKLVSSTFVQVTSLVIIVSLGYSYVRYQKQQDLAHRIAEIETTREMAEIEQSIEHDKYTKAVAKKQSEAASVAAEIKPATPHVAALVTAPIQQAAPTIAAQNLAATTAPEVQRLPVNPADTTKSNPVAAQARHPLQLHMMFASMTSTLYAELLREAHEVATVGGANAGVISQIDARIQTARAAHSLVDLDSAESTSTHPLLMNQPVFVFKGVVDPVSGQNIGVTVQVTASLATDPGEIRLRVDVSRLMRDSTVNPPLEAFSISLPDSFNVARGSGVMVAGILPRRVAEIDEKLYRTVNILRIVTAPAYKTGDAEVAVFLLPK